MTNQNLAQPIPGTALVMDNIFPTETGCRIRGGAKKYATLSASATPVVGMFNYVNNAGGERAFAATASAIYDITAVADPDAALTPVVSSLTNGDWQTIQVGTAGGDFLLAFNGHDNALLYDGSTWGATTITGVATSDISYAFTHQNRVWLLKDGSLDAYYLAPGLIGGAATLFSLKSVFKGGGYLLFGGTWSMDAGDGPDDYCFFVSSTGEVLLYRGTDPAAIDTFSQVGRYQLGEPLGRRAWMVSGGDVIIATSDGAVPLSAAFNKDPAALQLSAVSRNIEPDWRAQYKARLAAPWQMLKWPAQSMGVVSLPHTSTDPVALVVNLETGAWCRYTGWDIQAMTTRGDHAYFGDSSGVVYQMETGGWDGDQPYVAQLAYAFEELGGRGRGVSVHQTRAILLSSAEIDPKLSIGVNYQLTFPAAPNAVTSDTPPALWGTAIWGQSKWGDSGDGEFVGVQPTVSTSWVSTPAYGIAISPQVQLTSGDARKPDAEIVELVVVYELAEMVA